MMLSAHPHKYPLGEARAHEFSSARIRITVDSGWPYRIAGYLVVAAHDATAPTGRNIPTATDSGTGLQA
ncbi:hypothetical protein D9M69_553900 [compost metagenome]